MALKQSPSVNNNLQSVDIDITWDLQSLQCFCPVVGRSEQQIVQLPPIAFIKSQSEFAHNHNSSSSSPKLHVEAIRSCKLDANRDRDGYFQCDRSKLQTPAFIHNLLSDQSLIIAFPCQLLTSFCVAQ